MMQADGGEKPQFVPKQKKKKKKKKKKDKEQVKKEEVSHYDQKPKKKKKRKRDQESRQEQWRKRNEKNLKELKNVWTPGMAQRPSRPRRGPVGGGRAKKEDAKQEAFDNVPVIPVLSHTEEAAIVTDDEDPDYEINQSASRPIRLVEFDTCNLDAPEPAVFFQQQRSLSSPLLMQLPPVIPLAVFDEVKTVKQEIRGAKSVVLGSATSGFTKTENPLTHPELRNGHVADLVIRESGKVQLIFGSGSEQIALDVEPGPMARCVEELVSIELGDDKTCNFLGKIRPEDHLLCTYNIDQLLKNAR